MPKREKIPEALKRQIRQECYFGCAICGMPIFDYDHIIPYSKVLKHELENLILLCPNHHRSKGNHLDIDRIREAKLNPFNKGKSILGGYKLEPNRKVNIKIGSNTTDTRFDNNNGMYSCLWINGISFFAIHCIEGWISFSFVITDAIGQTILSVEYGELKFSANIWDYKYEGANLQIRTGEGEIIVDLILTNHKVEILRGGFIHSPYMDGFVVQPDGALITIVNGQCLGMSVGSSCFGGNGGFGLLNKTNYPTIIPPGGFGSFRQF